MKTTSKIRSKNRRFVRFAIVGIVAAIALGSTAAMALGGPPVPTEQAVTFRVATRHVTGDVTIDLGVYTSNPPSSPTVATFSGSLALRNRAAQGGQHQVFAHCNLEIGSPARVVGTVSVAGVGDALPGTGYPTWPVAITGTFNARAGDPLVLHCATSEAADAILTGGQVVINRVGSALVVVR